MMAATLTGQKTRVNAARGLQRAQWPAYFERLNRRDDLWLTIEAQGRRTRMIEAEPVPLNSIALDDADDRIVIAVGGPDERCHRAEHPHLIHTAEHHDDPVTLTITSDDGDRTVLRFGAPGDE
jgi:hypothetical protein